MHASLAKEVSSELRRTCQRSSIALLARARSRKCALLSRQDADWQRCDSVREPLCLSYEAQDLDNGSLLAWNEIDISKWDAKDRARVLKEVTFLRTLRHPNLIKFFGAWMNADKTHVIFITELMSSGTLKQLRGLQGPPLVCHRANDARDTWYRVCPAGSALGWLCLAGRSRSTVEIFYPV